MLKSTCKDNDGWSALMRVSSNGRTELAKLLLVRDAQFNMQKQRWTGLP